MRLLELADKGGPAKSLALPNTREFFDLAVRHYQTAKWARILEATESMFDKEFFRKFRTYVAAVENELSFHKQLEGTIKPF